MAEVNITENFQVTEEEESPLNEYNRFESNLSGILIQKEGLTDVPDSNDINGRSQEVRNILGLEWQNQRAVARVYQTLNLLGKRSPDAIDQKKGGLVIWRNVRTKVPNYRGQYGMYNRIEIRDEAILHTKPVDHVDFYYLGVNMRLPVDKAREISEITDSVYYYGRGAELWSTCGEMEASMATFAIVKMFAAGAKSKEELREYYDVLVTKVLTEFFENERQNVNDPYSLPTPIRDSIEQYIFSTDNRALGIFGGAALGGLAGGALGGTAGFIGGAALGGLAGGALAGRRGNY